MTVARGKVRRLLILIGKIQTLAGRAKHTYLNDRNRGMADQLLPVLDEIFDICLEARNEYDPIRDDKKGGAK